jgi:hypothetical protein
VPSLAQLSAAWDGILQALPQRVRVRFASGRLVDPTATHAVLALPNDVHRNRCEELRADVEQALAAHFGRPVALRLVADGAAVADVRDAAPPPPEPDAAPEEHIDLDELTDAPAGGGILDQLTSAFPGAELVDDNPTPRG